MASNKKSVPNLSGLARGSDPAKSHKDVPGRHQFSAENQPKAKRGRPKGALNKLTKTTQALLFQAATEVGDSDVPGEDGKGGLLGYFKASAVLERKTYIILLGRALPLRVNATTVTHKAILTREEAIAELKLRGLSDQIIDLLQPVEYVLDEPDPYGDDDAIDAEAAK